MLVRMKKLLTFSLCLLLVLSGALSMGVYAQKDEQKVVRVGWYESAFHHTDQFGRRSGYGYEYQQRIAVYTGWTYEYVEGSWSELIEMLMAGEIDLLSDVSYTEARAQKLLYSAEAMGAEDYHAFISPDNTEITPEDFSTMNGKRVGVNKNSIQEQLFIEWAKNHDVHPHLVELSGKTPELLDMLAHGEIDVLVTLDSYGGLADVVPVCKIGAADSYFGVNMNRPDIKRELDVAMNRIFEENRNFNKQLAEQFNETGALSSFLSKEEKSWLDAHGTIRVGYRESFLPFCAQDEHSGELTGALKDWLAFAETCEKNARLDFETIPYPTAEEALEALKNGEIDCAFPVNISAYDSEQRGIIVTDPLVSTEMFVAVRRADKLSVSPEREMRVAVMEGQPSDVTFLKAYFPNWQMVNCASIGDCFRAVGQDAADCTLVSNYRISRVSGLCTKYRLSTLTTGESSTLSMAMNREDDALYSIINKVNQLMPKDKVNTMLTSYAFTGERVTFMDYLRDNLLMVLSAAAITIFVLLMLILRNVRSEKNVSEGRRIISETERDHLTRLYNRSFLLAYANRIVQEHPDKAMDAVVVNIERFHTLNTLNGRSFGDEVLRALGGEVSAFLAGDDGIAGRVESDRFDIFCAHREDYHEVLNRLQTHLNETFRNADIRLRMGVMPWQKGVAPEQMFDCAWSACSMVRGDFKTHLMVYNEDLRHREMYSQRLQNDLARALEEHELDVYYQPKFAIQTERPTLSSAEALVRWRHPELGLIPPCDFIPLFERSGQITAVDKYVWAEAARQTAAWRDQFGIRLPVSVNLSRVDIFDPELIPTLDGILSRNNLACADFKLEVTESVYTENADHLIRVIGQLRAKGYEIEMDDFGSGYSSLNMLSALPIDVLKMDMAFVRNIERNERDFRLVRLILDIARYLKVPVVAEGVETETQLRLLRDAGCDLVQGYYFSRPLLAADFEKTILADAAKK